MKVCDFLRKRAMVQPSPVAELDDSRLVDTKSTFVPVITPSGVLISVEKKIKQEDLDVPYTSFNNEFMQKLGGFSVNVPLSNFAVFDALSSALKSVPAANNDVKPEN